jgi:DNA-binding MarR family transcriptional regulator
MRKIAKGLSSREKAPVDKEVAARFLELFRRMKRYVREEFPPFAKKGLSEEKLRCLGALRFLGKSHLKPLAAFDGLSSSSQCIMLNQLVTGRLVSRSEDPSDRRNVFYELTGEGTNVVNTAVAKRVEFLCARLGRLGKEEKGRFARALAVALCMVDKLQSSESRP